MFTASALRTADVLKAFIAQSYPRWELNDEDVPSLLVHTGGVASLVHLAWTTMCAAVEDGDRVAGFVAAEAAFNADSGHLRHMRPGQAVDSRSDVRAAITPFALRHSTAIH